VDSACPCQSVVSMEHMLYTSACGFKPPICMID
jgi:hypothetical protein